MSGDREGLLWLVGPPTVVFTGANDKHDSAEFTRVVLIDVSHPDSLEDTPFERLFP